MSRSVYEEQVGDGIAPEDCACRYTVTPVGSAPHGCGYGCGATGGHCRPTYRCTKFREIYQQQFGDVSKEGLE